MAITGISVVSLDVSDQDKALDFYTNKLGFEKRMDAPFFDGTQEHRWLTVAPPGSSTQIVLIKGYGDWSEERVGRNSSGISFSVEDIVGTFADLKAKGVEITEEPNQQPWGMQAQFKDDDGNSFVVVGQ